MPQDGRKGHLREGVLGADGACEIGKRRNRKVVMGLRNATLSKVETPRARQAVPKASQRGKGMALEDAGKILVKVEGGGRDQVPGVGQG